VWGQLEPVDADIDFDQLEDEFASKATAILKGNRDKGPKLKTLLTQQRAQNVSVFLATLRMTPAQVRPSAPWSLQACAFSHQGQEIQCSCKEIGISLMPHLRKGWGLRPVR
jgi:hypothetical protein